MKTNEKMKLKFLLPHCRIPFWTCTFRLGTSYKTRWKTKQLKNIESFKSCSCQNQLIKAHREKKGTFCVIFTRHSERTTMSQERKEQREIKTEKGKNAGKPEKSNTSSVIMMTIESTEWLIEHRMGFSQICMLQRSRIFITSGRLWQLNWESKKELLLTWIPNMLQRRTMGIRERN